jgi:sRNA-binding protein
LAELAARWPALFASTEARPLAIGIHQQILEQLPATDPQLLGTALRLHTRRAGYVAAILSAGHPRFDLLGGPVGTVTQEQVERLMAERARLAEKSVRRRAEEQRYARRRRVAKVAAR